MTTQTIQLIRTAKESLVSLVKDEVKIFAISGVSAIIFGLTGMESKSLLETSFDLGSGGYSGFRDKYVMPLTNLAILTFPHLYLHPTLEQMHETLDATLSFGFAYAVGRGLRSLLK